MNRVLFGSVLSAIAISLVLFGATPGNHTPRIAFAASGATHGFPPNHDFDAPLVSVGGAPTNHDFASGGTGWTKIGTVTYTGGVAKMQGSSLLTSSSFTANTSTQGIKIRYKAGAPAQVQLLNSGGSQVGGDNLSCVGCTTGAWVDKYIGVYPSALGGSIKVRFVQSSGTSEIDEAGTQWITFDRWTGTTTGLHAQPRGDGDGFAEVKGPLFSEDFHLTDNRIEFDYSFPQSGGTYLFAELRDAGTNSVLESKTISNSGTVGWTKVNWTWTTNRKGTLVYLRLYNGASKPFWIDDIGRNLVETTGGPTERSVDDGDPVDTATGRATHSHTDMAIPGKGLPLEFSRTYQSMSATPGDLGYNWRHTYSAILRIDSDNSVTVYYPSGGAAFFKYNSGSYTQPDGIHDSLVKNGDGTYTLTTRARSSSISVPRASSQAWSTVTATRSQFHTTAADISARLRVPVGERSLSPRCDRPNSRDRGPTRPDRGVRV